MKFALLSVPFCILCASLAGNTLVAQEPEAAPLPDDWGRIEKAVDLSLDQVQALRTHLAAIKTAQAEWDAANRANFEKLQKELDAARKAQDTETAAKLNAQLQPLKNERSAIKHKTEDQMKAVLRPEQQAAWTLVGRHKNLITQISELPGMTDEQKSKLAATFKDFTLAMGTWEAATTPELDRLQKADTENRAAREAAKANPVTAEKKAELEAQHKQLNSAGNALLAERKQRSDAFRASIMALLTPEQRAAYEAQRQKSELEKQTRKLNDAAAAKPAAPAATEAPAAVPQPAAPAPVAP
jgi:hypothetical protein